MKINTASRSIAPETTNTTANRSADSVVWWRDPKAARGIFYVTSGEMTEDALCAASIEAKALVMDETSLGGAWEA